MEDASSGVYSRANSSALSLVKMPFNICIFVFQHVVSNYCAILSSIVKHRFHVWLKVFGFTAARQNIKQDLVAVLQKVVEVISTMIQSQTLFFFQKPATEPDKVLQFTVTEDGARLGFPHLHHLPLLRPHQ